MGYKIDCRLFNGYKPCKHKRSCEDCPHYEKPLNRICVLSLEAMGAVLRSTCLLPAIKRSYPDSHITWVTLPQCKALLTNNRYIDRIVTVSAQSMAAIGFLEFDILYSVDKSLEAGAFAQLIKAEKKFGFGLNADGVIVPFNKGAAYQYSLGLDDELKFFQNEKAETQQITETMELEWKRDEYVLELSDEEKRLTEHRKREIIPEAAKGVIGYNTGCSLLFPYKKFTIERATEMVKAWRESLPNYAIALLGGPEDTLRQRAIKSQFEDDPFVVNTPTEEGLRSGIIWMDIADLVFSGCSLGMHIAIGLKKQVIAWFGVSCLQEVDLYGRGVRIQSDVTCSPCWKKSCDTEVKCFDRVDPAVIVEATRSILKID